MSPNSISELTNYQTTHINKPINHRLTNTNHRSTSDTTYHNNEQLTLSTIKIRTPIKNKQNIL
jgi:hypothetical protein